MYHKHHTKGIVAYGMNEGDDSRRVWVFTEDFGLISAKVQGSRKSISRLRLGTQDFSSGSFSLVKGKMGWRLVGANIDSNFFEDLRFSKSRLSIAKNVLSFINKNIGMEEENKPLFKMILDFFCFLKSTDESKGPLAECLIMLRIIHNLGFLKHDPELSPHLSMSDLNDNELKLVAPKKKKMIELINESMKSAEFSI